MGFCTVVIGTYKMKCTIMDHQVENLSKKNVLEAVANLSTCTAVGRPCSLAWSLHEGQDFIVLVKLAAD